MEKLLTRDDIIRAGACTDGVYAWTKGDAYTALPARAILRLCHDDERGYVTNAAGMTGYGDGNGDGYGYGNGDGDGYGNGDGYGYGYCNGNGYGDGYGNGYGDYG